MTDKTPTTRRRFLGGAAGLAAAGVTAARADNAKNLPPNVASWTRQLGEGVGVRAYGVPSKYEKDVVRRTVPWLTATPESSVSFTPLHQLDGIITPNGLCFERHHGGIAEIDPADYRLMLHGLVEKPLSFHSRRTQASAARQQNLFSGVCGQFRHGVARRSTQWLPIHARHGALRAIHGRFAEIVAGAGGSQAEREMDHGRGRRCRSDEPFHPAGQGD